MELTKNQKLWIEALRSGKYQQGTGVLESRGKFCCLGVACKVAEEQGVRVIYTPFGDLHGGILTHQKDVQAWLGLRSNDGSSSNPNRELDKDFNRELDNDFYRLINLNDKYGKSFEEIADIIEAHPEWYFVNETKN